MYDEEEIHRNKLTNKTYVSRRLPTLEGPLRIASKVFDSEGLHHVKVKNEVVLRRTATGRTEIVAKFLEDDRRLTVVSFQAFNGNTGSPHKTHFSFPDGHPNSPTCGHLKFPHPERGVTTG